MKQRGAGNIRKPGLRSGWTVPHTNNTEENMKNIGVYLFALCFLAFKCLKVLHTGPLRGNFHSGQHLVSLTCVMKGMSVEGSVYI